MLFLKPKSANASQSFFNPKRVMATPDKTAMPLTIRGKRNIRRVSIRAVIVPTWMSLSSVR